MENKQDFDAVSALPSSDDDNALGGFFNILTPGSSLNPTFLLIVDIVLACLLLIFFALLLLSQGSPHFLFLMMITGCLWASVKWFVAELKNVKAQETAVRNTNAQPDSSKHKVE